MVRTWSHMAQAALLRAASVVALTNLSVQVMISAGSTYCIACLPGSCSTNSSSLLRCNEDTNVARIAARFDQASVIQYRTCQPLQAVMSLHEEDAPVTGFMALPPEIRLKIYEMIMHQEKSHDPLNKNPNEDATVRYERDLDLSRNKRRRLLNAPTEYLGLLSCNRAIRTEFGAVFWGTNPFSVVVDSKNSDLRDFIANVASCKPIKKMKLSLVLHPAFNSSFVDDLQAFPLLQDLELDIYQGLLPKNAAVGALYLATALRKFISAFKDLPAADKPAKRVLRIRRIVVLAGSKMNTSKGYNAFVRRLEENLDEVFQGCEDSERWSFKPEKAIVAQEYRYGGCDRRKFEVLVDGKWIDWY